MTKQEKQLEESAQNATNHDMASMPEAPEGPLTPGASVRRGMKLVGIQFAALILVSILIAAFDLDRAVSGLFYRPEAGGFMAKDGPWRWIYLYGTIPGALLALGCLVAWLVTFFKGRLASWRPYLLLVVLTTVIAGGVLVNGILKSYWGRPRPNQTTEFGGYYTYRHVFPPGTPGKGASFPCGHCTMGFSMLSLFFVRRRSNVLAWGGTAAGIVLGVLLSIARIINGAHFLSDAIWSLGIVSMTAVSLYYCLLKIPARQSVVRARHLAPGRKIALTAAVGVMVLLMIIGFMTRRPFFKTTEYYPQLTNDTQRLVIELNREPDKLVVTDRHQGAPAVLLHAHGFGWAYVDYEIQYAYQRVGSTLILRIQIEPRSYFAELDHTLEVVMPERWRESLKILVNPETIPP